MDKSKQPEAPQPEVNTDAQEKPEAFDPREQAIKYKAYRDIFSDRDVKKGLDEKTIIRKIKKSTALSGKYRQYLEMRDEKKCGNRVYPWQNPFNHCLFWTAYWLPRFLKWSTLLAMVLFILNYIPGPTQHIIEVLIARAIYDTAPIERLPDDLETYAHSADIKDSRGSIIKSYGKRKVTQQIPATAQKALLACEDHYFLPHPGNSWYENLFLIHSGVSWLNLVGAVKDTLQGDPRGASTLVMQNAKKILGNEQRTIANKLEEIIIAYMMVAKFGKEKNLNYYINTVPVGANIYGFPAAATNYFKKDLAALNLQQLVTIGSFIPNHNRQVAFYEIANGKNFSDLSPIMQGHAKNAINKINLALTHLWKHKEIPDDQYQRWLLTDEESIRRLGFRDFRSPLYGEEEWTSWNVIKEVSSRTYTINGREISGSQLLLEEKGDVSIETGTDLLLIEKMKEIIGEFLQSSYFKEILASSNQSTWLRDKERYTSRGLTPPYTDFSSFLGYLQRNINVGILAVNQKGEIVAYVGGKEFLQTRNNENDEEEAPDLSEIGANKSTDKNGSHDSVIIDIMNRKAKITPSSTMKPIIAYYAMVANNAKMSDRFADKPIEYKYVASDGRQTWLPRNWYNYDGSRPMGREYSLLEAQVISINTIFARLYTNPLLRSAMLLGFDQVGLDYSKEDAKYWPFGIGSSAVSVQQWLGIYNAFLDGQYRDPSFVRRIQVNGKTVYDRDQDQQYAKIPLFESRKEREAEVNALYEVCNRGTGSAMKTEFKHHKNLVSGKTGTAPMNKSALFISHFNPYRDRQTHKDRTITMLISVTTNTGGFKSVGTSGNAPAKIAGRIYNHLFQQEMQEMMDKNIDKAKRTDTNFRNNQFYQANVNRYINTLLTGKCGNSLIADNIVGVDDYREALMQILNSSTKIYTGRDDIFSQLVQYYCDQEKMVRIDSTPVN